MPVTLLDRWRLVRALTLDRDIVGASDIAVLVALIEREGRATGKCCPSYETVAADTGRSRSVVAEAIARLRRLGYLEVAAGGGRSRSNDYRINYSKGETVRAAGLNGDEQSGQSDGFETGNRPADTRETVRPTPGKPSGAPDPNPLIEPAKEPVRERGARARPPAPGAGAAAATRLAPGWRPSAELVAWSLAEPGASPELLERSVWNFVDWYRSAAGDKGRSRDWDASWRIWWRREIDRQARAGPDRGLSPADLARAADPFGVRRMAGAE